MNQIHITDPEIHVHYTGAGSPGSHPPLELIEFEALVTH